ncbi:Ger(x)C family spore germination protein [Mammaliicoccus sciuri]
MKHRCSSVKCLILTFLLTGTVILQSGCAFKDIDKRLFVSAIGVDPAENIENGYKVTLKIALPYGAIKESTQPSYAYLSKEGETIGESIRMLETHVDKVLELGHMKVIVINEELLSGSFQPFMDYFFRRGDFQLISYVAAARPSAEKILKTEPKTEAPASVSLFNYFGDTGTESPYIITTYLFQLRRDYYMEGISPVLPIITTNGDHEELIVNESMVIGAENESAMLDDIETKYYNSLFKDASGFSYKVEKGDMRLLLNFDRIKMKYQIITKDGVPQAIDMKVKMEGEIGESRQSLSLSNLDQYNKIAEEEIKKKTLRLLKDMQEKELDPFGFGLHYRATRLEKEGLYKTWKEVYPELEFRVSVDVKLMSMGTSQ